MGPESWTIIGVGVVILVAIAASNRSMRQDFNTQMDDLRKELRDDLKRIEERIDERIAGVERGLRGEIRRLEERITTVERVLREEVKRLDERITAVETRLAEVVGTLKGMRKSMFDPDSQ